MCVGLAGLCWTCTATEFNGSGLVRFARAGLTVCQIVADYRWSLSGAPPGGPEREAVRAAAHERSAERLHWLCCVNRGCFIKVGQHLAALNYLLPEPYVRVLGRLHSDAPASTIEEVRQVIAEDFGQPADTIFRRIDPKPCGAASLAQVHRAELLDGTPVAVKVQHPHVLARSAIDMATMDWLAAVVSRLLPEFRFQWLAEETRRNLPLELDFTAEAGNMERARRLYAAKFPFLEVPRAVPGLVSRRVLTMEFCQGGQIDDRAFIDANRLDRRQIVRQLNLLYSDMIFNCGFVHSDPHPGNLLVRPDPSLRSGVRLVLLDHGLYRQLTPEFRLAYCRLWRALIDGDVAGIRLSAESLGCGHLYGLFACMVSGRSWQAVTAGVSQNEFSTDEELVIHADAERHLPQITQVLESVPRQMLLLFKTNDLLRGLEYRLTGRQRFGPGLSFAQLSYACLSALANQRGPGPAAEWRDWLRLRWRLCQLWALHTAYSLWASVAPVVGLVLGGAKHSSY